MLYSGIDAVMRFVWAVGVKLAESHFRMLAQYDSESSVTEQKVLEWVERFKLRRANVTD